MQTLKFDYQPWRTFRTMVWGGTWVLVWCTLLTAGQAHAAQNDGGNAGMGFIWLGLILLCYFFPTVVANVRKHNHVMAIFCTNLFLGWTFIGWVVALVWACMNTVKSRVTA